MKNIAITGSFASGKSFILNCIKSMGYKVFSCDDYVGQLYEDIVFQKLIGSEIEGFGKFNKKNLAKIIFSNNVARKKLEKIIHPRALEAIRGFEEDNIKEALVFTEIPLLFEAGFAKHFFRSICVFCSEEAREERAGSRRGATGSDLFEKIKKTQLSQGEKIRRSDFSVDSEMDAHKIENSLRNIINNVI